MSSAAEWLAMAADVIVHVYFAVLVFLIAYVVYANPIIVAQHWVAVA